MTHPIVNPDRSQELVQHYQQKADSALESTLPHIEQSLSEDINSLEFLDEHLPRIEEELVSIRRVYDRGQDKVCFRTADNALRISLLMLTNGL